MYRKQKCKHARKFPRAIKLYIGNNKLHRQQKCQHARNLRNNENLDPWLISSSGKKFTNKLT